jgi:glycosyltransferase involved in cell wall biosynthesis
VRVLLINDYGGRYAGAETLTLGLRSALRERGHDARLLASDARLLPGENLADYRCAGTTSRFQPLFEAYNVSAARAVRRAIAEFRPDVVHVSMFLWQLSPAILRPLRDVPAVYHVMTYKPVCPLGTKMLPDGSPCRHAAGRICRSGGCQAWPSWIARGAQQLLWRRWRGAFDRIVPISASVGAALREAGIAVLPPLAPGVAVREPRPPLSDPPVVAFAGRLAREKGVDVLLRAMPAVLARVPEARLLVAGDGPDSTRLRGLAARLGIEGRTRFVGHLSARELDDALCPAWVQVVPSLWHEPFGLVAPEAMMRGTAVVATAAGGLRDSVVDGKTGLLVPIGDTDALGAALARVLSSKETAEAMGAAGRRRAIDEFQESAVVDAFLAIYADMLAA